MVFTLYLSYQDYIEHDGLIWRVNTKKSGMHTKPFKRWLDQLYAMFNKHSKVFAYRFDLSFPTDSLRSINDHTQFDKFFTRLKKQLKNHYPSSLIGYAWAAEVETSKNQHYHVVLMLNGHEVQSPKWLQSRISRIWTEVGGSTPHWSRFYRLNRSELTISPESLLLSDKELIESLELVGLVYQVSYLFKGRGKGYLQDGAHNYGHSRLRIK
jgi:hypothetical protein